MYWFSSPSWNVINPNKYPIHPTPTTKYLLSIHFTGLSTSFTQIALIVIPIEYKGIDLLGNLPLLPKWFTWDKFMVLWYKSQCFVCKQFAYKSIIQLVAPMTEACYMHDQYFQFLCTIFYNKAGVMYDVKILWPLNMLQEHKNHAIAVL